MQSKLAAGESRQSAHCCGHKSRWCGVRPAVSIRGVAYGVTFCKGSDATLEFASFDAGRTRQAIPCSHALIDTAGTPKSRQSRHLHSPRI